MDRLRKRANKKNRKGFAALKKMKDGGKVKRKVKRGEMKKVTEFREIKPIDPNVNPETGRYYRYPGGAKGNTKSAILKRKLER